MTKDKETYIGSPGSALSLQMANEVAKAGGVTLNYLLQKYPIKQTLPNKSDERWHPFNLPIFFQKTDD